MNKTAMSFVAGAAVVAAAGYGTLVYPQARAKQQVDRAIAELPAHVKVKYQSLSYSLFTDTLVLGGFEAVVHEDGDIITTRVASVSVRQIGQSRLGEVRGVGVTLDSAEPFLHLEAEEMSGADLEAPQNVITGLVSTAALKAKRLALTGVSAVTADGKVKMREVVISDYVQTEKWPTAMSLGVHGFEVDPASLSGQDMRAGLAALGYDRLSLNIDLNYTLAQDSKRLNVTQAAISGEGIGRLSLSFALGGVQAAALEDPILALAAAQAATLESLELRYDDETLAGRLMTLAAREAGAEEAEFKASLLEQVTEAGANAPDTPLTRELVASVTAFLTHPKSLSLRLKPTQPLPLYRLAAGNQEPYAMAKLLGVSVSANR